MKDIDVLSYIVLLGFFFMFTFFFVKTHDNKSNFECHEIKHKYLEERIIILEKEVLNLRMEKYKTEK